MRALAFEVVRRARNDYPFARRVKSHKVGFDLLDLVLQVFVVLGLRRLPVLGEVKLRLGPVEDRTDDPCVARFKAVEADAPSGIPEAIVEDVLEYVDDACVDRGEDLFGPARIGPHRPRVGR